MTKRLTYKQLVRRKFPGAGTWGAEHLGIWCIETTRLGRRRRISNYCTRRRDAWRSAWRNLKGRK